MRIIRIPSNKEKISAEKEYRQFKKNIIQKAKNYRRKVKAYTLNNFIQDLEFDSQIKRKAHELNVKLFGDEGMIRRRIAGIKDTDFMKKSPPLHLSIAQIHRYFNKGVFQFHNG